MFKYVCGSAHIGPNSACESSAHLNHVNLRSLCPSRLVISITLENDK